jgi:hypothetical protein
MPVPSLGISLVQSGGGSVAPVTPGGWSPVSLTNDEAVPITLGQVVYLFANDAVKLAFSNGTMTQATAVGMVVDASIAAGSAGKVVFGGRVPGLSGGAVNALGYLGHTAGAIANTPDLTVGEYNTLLGYWLSGTEFQFAPMLPIAN